MSVALRFIAFLFCFLLICKQNDFLLLLSLARRCFLLRDLVVVDIHQIVLEGICAEQQQQQR